MAHLDRLELRPERRGDGQQRLDEEPGQDRRAERDREESKRKSRQEQRKALGLDLDPLADDYNDDGLAANERDIAKDAEREKLADKRPDPLLRESAAILADAVRLLNNDRQLSAQVLPTATTAGHWAD